MSKKVMVCVTPQKSCDRLIEQGYNLCTEKKDALFIIHVADYDFKFEEHTEEGEALDYLYEQAFAHRANLTVVRSNDLLGTLVNLVRKNKATHIVVGASGNPDDEHNMVLKLKAKVWDQAEFVVVPALS
ncbi:MAG: universal stress protein [Firmicutes bacterium]|nr:universal stress protein UspA [Clostridiales bacterium]MBQ9932169.1 universal stress protein [Bacillota bacterium]